MHAVFPVYEWIKIILRLNDLCCLSAVGLVSSVFPDVDLSG